MTKISGASFAGVMKRNSRTPCKFPDSLHHRLNAYALAAGAAGVGMLALSQPAQAKIAYTKAHEVIGLYGSHSYSLDLNHDGIVDFSLNWTRDTSAWRQDLPVSERKHSIVGD